METCSNKSTLLIRYFFLIDIKNRCFKFLKLKRRFVIKNKIKESSIYRGKHKKSLINTVKEPNINSNMQMLF